MLVVIYYTTTKNYYTVFQYNFIYKNRQEAGYDQQVVAYWPFLYTNIYLNTYDCC